MNNLKDVVLVVPPFGSLEYPSLAASTLVAGCRGIGLDAYVLYASIALGGLIGVPTYQAICRAPLADLVGERVFAPHAYPDAYELAPPSPFLAGEEFYSSIADFVNDTVLRILDTGAKIVGFSTTFQQTAAAVAIARQLHNLSPSTITVLGGANASYPMGAALMGITDAFDFIFSGEADKEFPLFCRDFIDKEELPKSRLICCNPIQAMDSLPRPDFTDYFTEISVLQCGPTPIFMPEFLPFETSRGCWWGERRHCTFCGLNGSNMTYRHKSTERVLSELRELASRYKVRRLHAADNIMPVKFAREVLPVLSIEKLNVELFYEVKSNIGEVDLDEFVRAGVTHIQPGIESFSSHILWLIRKGVSGIKNLWLLRECESRQIDVAWNLLYGVPGELREDYESMLRLIPLIQHLQPPMALSPIVIDRYSPYFDTPSTFGISNVNPLPAYSLVFPDGSPLHDLAYHFSGDYSTEYLEAQPLREAFASAITNWRAAWSDAASAPLLFGMPLPEGELLVEDSRTCAVEQISSLSPSAAEVLRALDHWKPSELVPMADGIIKDLKRRGFVVEHEGLLMSVVLDPMKTNRFLIRQ